MDKPLKIKFPADELRNMLRAEDYDGAVALMAQHEQLVRSAMEDPDPPEAPEEWHLYLAEMERFRVEVQQQANNVQTLLNSQTSLRRGVRAYRAQMAAA